MLHNIDVISKRYKSVHYRDQYGSFMYFYVQNVGLKVCLVNLSVFALKGRSALNHSTNGVMVGIPSKKQTCP